MAARMSKDMDNIYNPSEADPVEEVVIVEDGKKVKVKTPPTAANTYAAKKTVAQGMMDIALITSNANQLRYLLEYGQNSPTFYMNVILITISLILQAFIYGGTDDIQGEIRHCLQHERIKLPMVAVGVSLVFKGRYDLGGEAKLAHANRLNNYVVVGVFMVTIINVFAAAFSVSGNGTTTPVNGDVKV